MNGFIEALRNRREEIGQKRIVVGYDGFVDTTVRPIAQTATEEAPARMFQTIKEFGEFLVSKSEKSCSIELQVESRHLGGNMPFLSLGAGTLGLDVTCIGMLGEGGVVEEPFRNMPCTLYPFTGSGQSTCMEFRDGKVLMAPSVTIPRDGWNMVLEATQGKAIPLLTEADLIALVNWSELTFAQRLWTRTYEEALRGVSCDKDKYAFFDLCDISRKTEMEIQKVLSLIADFSRRRTTILSLNENEAHIVSERILDGQTDCLAIGRALRERYQMDEIIIHTIYQSFLISARGEHCCATDFVKEPVISTGAGDHFNAGSCLGAVMGLADEQRLQLANQVAGHYVRTGHSPGMSVVLAGV